MKKTHGGREFQKELDLGRDDDDDDDDDDEHDLDGYFLIESGSLANFGCSFQAR